MIWILIFAALALAGVVALAGYGVGLAHKAADVRHETQVVGDRVKQITALVGQLELPNHEARLD